MKKMISVFALFIGFSVAFNGAAFAMGKKPGVPTISKEELSQKMQSGEVQVVDVLDPDTYQTLGVIKGSMKIPLKELDQRLNELEKSKEVVTYCASYQCGASKDAALKLAALGYNVRAYEGGVKEWKEAGLPVE